MDISIIFPAHPQHAALPAELGWRFLVIECQEPLGLFPREIQELRSDPSPISSYVGVWGRQRPLLYTLRLRKFMEHFQMMHLPGHCHSGAFQVFKQWIAGRQHFIYLYVLCILCYLVWGQPMLGHVYLFRCPEMFHTFLKLCLTIAQFKFEPNPMQAC